VFVYLLLFYFDHEGNIFDIHANDNHDIEKQSLFHGYNRLQAHAQPIFHLYVRKQRGECEFYEVLLLFQANEEILEKMNVLDKRLSQKLFVVIQLFRPDIQ